MNTVVATVDKFLEATEIIEEWIKSLVKAQGIIIRSVEDLETGTKESVTRALKSFRRSFRSLNSSTEKTLRRLE